MRRLGTLGVVSLAILSLLLEGTAKSAAGAEAIYFTTSNFPASIQRVNKDGSGLQTLLTGVNAQSNLAIDVNAGKIYYSQSGMDISKAQGPISDIELDTDSKKLYLIAGSNETIVRMNLDSSNFEFLLSDSNSRFIALTLDLISEKIYFTDTLGNRIGRVNLDGSNIETLIQFDVNVDLNDIKLDVAGGKMYWTDQLTNKIQRANLDGTGIEDLVNDSGRSLALDLAAGKMYWPSPVFGGIRRANLDGSDVELVLASSADPFGLAFGPAFVPFAVFTATQVELALGPRANDDAFTIEATFSLGAASNGINPADSSVSCPRQPRMQPSRPGRVKVLDIP